MRQHPATWRIPGDLRRPHAAAPARASVRFVRPERPGPQGTDGSPEARDCGRLAGIRREENPGGSLFQDAPPLQLVCMLRKDLKAAGIAYRDDVDRVVDFHSFRAMFATLLIASEANLKVMQELCGHSAMTMTLGVCVKSLRVTHENAIADQPDYNEPRTMRSIGTDGSVDSVSVAKTALNSKQNGVDSEHIPARTNVGSGQRIAV